MNDETERRAATGRRDVVWVGLVAFGVIELAAGVLMAVSPGTFFEEIGPYGTRNDHYIRDIAGFTLALGALLLAAAARPTWRAPTLAFSALYYALHTVSHVIDVGDPEPSWHGPLDAILIGGGAVVLALLYLRVRRSEPAR